MKVELFDFNKNWDLVKPHLNDAEVVELLDQGMLHFSARWDHWSHLPAWDSKNDYGPWEYTKGDAHASYALDKVLSDLDYHELLDKYEKIIRKKKKNFDPIETHIEEFLFDSRNKGLSKIAKEYSKEYQNIELKYLPHKDSYKWYQCFGAADYLSEWSKKLAEKTFPNYRWKTYRKYRLKKVKGHDLKEKTGCTSIIGRNEVGNYLIFDIMLFDSISVDEILKAVGLNRNKLQNEFYKDVKKQLTSISIEIKFLAAKADTLSKALGKI